jgi:DNA-binding response OmpR family regulator
MTRTLLMIEDDDDAAHLVSRFLKRKSWNFHRAADGAQGLRQAAKVRPDVILLDIQLPDIEGWEICRRLKNDAALSKVPVVMVSGNKIDPAHKARGLEVGADDYLAKPYDLTELMLRVDAILSARGA